MNGSSGATNLRGASYPFERIEAAPEKAATSLQGLTKSTPANANEQGASMATPKPKPDLRPDDPRHGTTAGYNAHYKAHEAPCDPCKQAKARYEKRRHHDLHLGIARTVPSIGSRRRVRALQRLGWPLSAIANTGGWESPQALQYVMRSETIYRESRDRIAAVYEELSMTIPPTTSSTSRARKRAIRLGYAPPLAWENIDDPNETPHGLAETTHVGIDEVKVSRVVNGSLQDCNAAERYAVIEAWTGSLAELERLTGWHIHRMMKREAA